MKFEELNVNPAIIQGLKELGISKPTLIQEKAIPLIHSGKDVIGRSNTGSGKTLAFGVPILEKVKPREGIQVLILAPVRELAVQIAQELKKFGKYMDFQVATVFGGVALGPQVDEMAASEIVVGTPGRVLDHLNRRNMDFTKINCFVLDEADKMVEMGFIEDVEEILNFTPEGRQVLLFGATVSEEIGQIKEKYMSNPVIAQAAEHVAESFLEQYYYDIKQHEKFSLLVHLLKKEKTDRAIIFCSARTTVEMVNKNLRTQGIKSEMIHGKLSQNKRLHVIERFNAGKVDLLVASAVAARGLDIKDVTHVFNYDVSQDPQEYVHRVGRTARAGEKGKAITLLSERDHGSFNNVFRLYPDLDIKELHEATFPKIKFETGGHQRNFGGPRRSGYSGDRSSHGSGARGHSSGNRGPRRSNSGSGRSHSSGNFGSRN